MRQIVVTEKDREAFIQLIRKVKLDKPFLASFTVHRKKRTIRQNRLFWMWMRCIRDDTGNDVQTLHDFFADKFLPWNIEKCFDVEVRKPHGTKNLNTKEFTDFLEQIRLDMLEQGIDLPQPGEMGWDEFVIKYGGDNG